MEIAHDLSIVQEATTSNYCEKCDITFKSKKRLRRHLIKGHITVGKLACGRCDDVFKTWTDLRVHAYKIHENDDDDEENKKGINEDNMVHKDKGKNDEAELKPNSRSMKDANKNISSTWISGRDEHDQYDPNLTNDENSIWKGRRRKLFQTSLTQIPMPVDNQNKRKKWLMSIGYKYQGYEFSDNDVWTFSSYYRISDERGQEKKTIILTGSRRRNEKEYATHILRGRK